MSQHAAFVLNTTVSMFGNPVYVVMCRACGRERPRVIAEADLGSGQAQRIAKQHNDSNIVTDVMGKAV